MPSAELLRAERISKHYDGVYALCGADFSVSRGEVHALMGENGAGKSTLAKVVAGAVKADSGRIFWQGTEASITSPLDAQRLGIAIIFQELDLFPNLSVAENLVIGNLDIEQRPFVRRDEVDQFCRPFLKQVGLTCGSQTPLHTLSIAQMQLVAIARALSLRSRLILMDEPTSSLSDDAVERLFELIASLKEAGVSTVFVSHKMNEIFRICDRITVLRDGETIGTRDIAATDAQEVITMMAGRELNTTMRPLHRVSQEVLLSVTHLTSPRLNDISFNLRRGEVLGIAGLVGAGRSELGHALFGLEHFVAGQITLNGKYIRIRSPRDAIDSGIGLLPEDRQLQGLMMQMSVQENTTMAIIGRLARWGWLKGRAESCAMSVLHERTALKTVSYRVPVSTLSGGNQQKVLLAKWLLCDPEVLFLDDPTRGIDVAAKRDIYAIIDAVAARGKGVLFVSSELPELLQCCDRILVLNEGCCTAIVDGATATQEAIMALAVPTGAVAGCA
jgi:ABC-type sugar transport system ATPase subunit